MKNKFKNIKVTCPNHGKFDSQGELARWQFLQLMLKAGEITEIDRQVTFPLVVNGVLVCKIRPDFVYKTIGGNEVAEDFKSVATITPAFRIKQKLFKALTGREISVVTKIKDWHY